MRFHQAFLVLVFGNLLLFCAHPVVAQEGPFAQSPTDLVSPWLVTIKGQARTLVLRIKSVKPKSSEAFSLDATYGFIDGRQDVVDAEVLQTATERKLRFTTQSGNRYVVIQTPNALFEGIYTNPQGDTREASIERISEEALKQRLASYQAERTAQIIVQPAPDVPQHCADFSGRWTGRWPNYGQTWLWVVEVGANCAAQCIGWNNSQIPNRFQSCEIKEKVLVRRNSEGVEYYELRGNELWARFVYSGGQNNAAFFWRLKPGEN